MDWDNIRQQWKTQPAHADPGVADSARLRDQADRLQRTIRRRDRWETIAAIVVGVFFALVAGGAASDGNWPRLGFALLIVAWAVYIPIHLRRARRQLPDPRPDLPLRSFLMRQREAALVQARMLEQAWLWYIAPGVAGLVGLTLSEDESQLIEANSKLTLISGIAGFVAAVPGVGLLQLPGGASWVLVLGAVLVWINRRTATRVFHPHAQALQRQIETLDDGPA